MSEELLQYKVLKPISFKGDRIEKGSVVHMTPEEAKNIGDEFLQLVEETKDEEISDKSAEPKEPENDKGTESEEDNKSSEENTDNTQTDTNTDENL